MVYVQEMVLTKASRRKLALHIIGANERKASAGSAADVSMKGNTEATAADSNGSAAEAAAPEEVQIIDDMWAFKRSQSLFPSIK